MLISVEVMDSPNDAGISRLIGCHYCIAKHMNKPLTSREQVSDQRWSPQYAWM